MSAAPARVTPRRPTTRLLVSAAALAGATLLALLMLHDAALLVLFSSRVPITSIQAPDGQRVWADLPHDGWSEQAGPPRASVHEDGRPLPAAGALHEDIRTLGEGRFSFWGSGVYFSSSDGTDPRTNGRTYEAVGPRPIGVFARSLVRLVAVTLLGFACVLWSGTAPRHTVTICLVLFLVALAARAIGWWVIGSDPVRFTEGVRVMGLPFNDARAWDTQGEMLLTGRGFYPGWEARRPFFGMFLAVVYFWGGISSILALAVNAIVSALCVPLVYLVGRALGGFVVGVCGALLLAAHPDVVDMSTRLLTETLGLFLCVLAVVLTAGVWRAPGRWRPLAAGLAFGLSNLTRPVIMLALPVWMLAVGGAVRRREGGATRAGVIAAALLAAGVVAALAPWAVRQKLTYGMWSMSDNSSALLYAATTPEHGEWTARVYVDAARDGVPATIRDQYEYFSRRARENLRANAGWYAGHVVASTGRAAADLRSAVPAGLVRPVAWTVLAAGAIGCLAAGGGARRRILAGLGLVGVGALLPVVPVTAMLVGACALSAGRALRARPALAAILLSTVLAGTVTSGLLGGVVIARTNFLTYWIVGLLFCDGVFTIARLARRWAGLGAAPGDDTGAPDAPAPESPLWRRRLPVVVATVLAIAFGVPAVVMGARNFVSPSPDPPHPPLDARNAASFVARLAAIEGDRPADPAPLISGAAPALLARRGTITRFVYALPADAVFDHWSPHLATRDYDRTYFQLDLGLGHRKAMLGGPLPDGWIGRDVVLFAVPNWSTVGDGPDETPLLEVIALAPCADDEGTPDWASLHWCRAAAHWRFVADVAREPRSGRRPGAEATFPGE